MKQKTKKASALAFSLIVLAIILVSAISIVSIAVTERQSAGSSANSVQGFQVADSATEIVLNQIYKGTNTDLNSLASNLRTTCSSGTIQGSLSSGKTYTVNFYKNDGTIAACGDLVSSIANIKSSGSYSSTTRAISMAVASMAFFPNYTNGISQSANQVYQASSNGYLDVQGWGSYMNNLEIEVGPTSSPSTVVWRAGDDFNSYTKGVGAMVPIKQGTYYEVLNPGDTWLSQYPYENLWVVFYPAS